MFTQHNIYNIYISDRGVLALINPFHLDCKTGFFAFLKISVHFSILKTKHDCYVKFASSMLYIKTNQSNTLKYLIAQRVNSKHHVLVRTLKKYKRRQGIKSSNATRVCRTSDTQKYSRVWSWVQQPISIVKTFHHRRRLQSLLTVGLVAEGRGPNPGEVGRLAEALGLGSVVILQGCPQVEIALCRLCCARFIRGYPKVLTLFQLF